MAITTVADRPVAADAEEVELVNTQSARTTSQRHRISIGHRGRLFLLSQLHKTFLLTCYRVSKDLAVRVHNRLAMSALTSPKSTRTQCCTEADWISAPSRQRLERSSRLSAQIAVSSVWVSLCVDKASLATIVPNRWLRVFGACGYVFSK